MNRFLMAVTVAALLLVAPLAVSQSVHDEIAMTRAQIQANRQAIVATALALPEEKGAAFWPLYREYRGEIDQLGDRTWALMADYSTKWTSLTDADATKLMKEWNAIEKKHLSLREKWTTRFSKAIGATQTARFFQIESKLDALIRLEALASIPVAQPAAK